MKTYIIPNNYIDEGRVVRGLFRTRYFIEGVILAIFGLAIAMSFSVETFNTRVTLIVCFCAPLFLLGASGIGGNPISIAVMNAVRWVENRSIMLYDNKPRALLKAPIDKMMTTTLKRDEIIDFMNKWNTDRQTKRLKQQFIEGETFKFNSDKDSMREYIDPESTEQEYVITKEFKFAITQEEFDEEFEISTVTLEGFDDDDEEEEDYSLEASLDAVPVIASSENKRRIKNYTEFEFKEAPPIVSVESGTLDLDKISEE